MRKMVIGDRLQEDGWAVHTTITSKPYPKSQVVVLPRGERYTMNFPG